MEIKIGPSVIGESHPTYFVADIAANHDGELERAIELIHLAAKAGANAAKFQNFSADEIVSDFGFRELGQQLGHQSKWTKSVAEVYKQASIPHAWTPHLKDACDKLGIEYFSAAYDFAAVDMLAPYVPAYKIGSGDLNWHEMIEYAASKGKPMLLATGASSLSEVTEAVHRILRKNSELVVMQCNTNYTGDPENFRFQNLNVLAQYSSLFPSVVLGLSDHTPGHATVLGAVALGARVIEKHFTDDPTREGPDHKFSMNPQEWETMVLRTRELEIALGDGEKVVEENELETVVIQRRSVRAKGHIRAGKQISREDISVLRPAPVGSIHADKVAEVVGRVASRDIEPDTLLDWSMFN